MSALGRLAAAGALALVLGACSSDNQVDREELRTPPAEVSDTDRPPAASEEVTSALDDPAHPDFPDPLIDLDDLSPGRAPARRHPVHRLPPVPGGLRGHLARGRRARALAHDRRADQGLPDPHHDVARDRQRPARRRPGRGDLLPAVQLRRRLRAHRRRRDDHVRASLASSTPTTSSCTTGSPSRCGPS